MYAPIIRLPRLAKGRTFICGDIHGCFSLLENKLQEVNFDVWCIDTGAYLGAGEGSLTLVQILS